MNCRGSSVGEEGDDDLETPDLVWVVLAVVEETPPPLVATDDCGAADFLDETFATSDSASVSEHRSPNSCQRKQTGP